MPGVTSRSAAALRFAAMLAGLVLLAFAAASALAACGGSSSTLNAVFKSDLGEGTWSAWQFKEDGSFAFLLHTPGDGEAAVADSGTYTLIGNLIETKSERGGERDKRLAYEGDRVQVEGELTVFKEVGQPE